MKRWKIPALFVLSIGTLLITCFALFLHRGTQERQEDLPIHPISGTSYSNSSKKHLNTVSKNHHNHNYHESIDESTHRHNYRKRFSDAIKGVFTDVLGKNGTDESKENNSSRLKRQLEVGSASESAEDPNDDYEIRKATPDTTSTQQTSTTSSTTRKVFTTRRPFMKILKFRNTKKPILLSGPEAPPKYSDEVSHSPDLSTSRFATSSEEANREGEKDRKENQSRRVNSIRRRFRVPVRSNGNYPSTLNKFDDDHDEESDFPRDPKNFTLEVVEVKRKVIRTEDKHIPPSFAKGQYNTGPKLAKSTENLENKPPTTYKANYSKERGPQQRPANRRGFTLESSKESNSAPINSAESSIEERKKPHSRERTSLELEVENNGRENITSSEKAVVVDLNKQVPHDDGDLTDEDLKDYNDGHSTFGSKGNFQHTIISRNVSGFLPNGGQDEDSDSHEGLRKRSGNNAGSGERKIVIEKGRVTETYPEVSGEIENPEIYTVPGGRRVSSETEDDSPNKEDFSFPRAGNSNGNAERKVRLRGRGGNNDETGDLTSPAIQTSLDELYRKGHPGVVPAPPVNAPSHKAHPFSEPYGESADYGSPFKYNPLVDDPPLKFDPESDRFYGSPVPDSKEKIGQSNSLVPVENRNRNEQDSPELPEELYQPQRKPKIERIRKPIRQRIEPVPQNSEDLEGVTEETEENEAEPQKNLRKIPNNNAFQYGRAYNPPDPGDYDSADYGNIEPVGLNNDRSDADFDAALEENFNVPNEEDDFFEFPGEDGGTVREVRKKFNSKPDNEVVRIDDNDYVEQNRKRPKPPSKLRKENAEDYEGEDAFAFAPPPRGGTRRNGRVEEEDDTAHEVYDSGFIQTLKQFDEEIKKLQEQERRKLLQSHNIPEQLQRTPIQPEKSNKPAKAGIGVNQELGYKKQGPPLVISSPGPLEEPPYDNPSSPPRDEDEVSNSEPELDRGVTSTLRVADNNGDHDQQEEPPTIRGKDKHIEDEIPLLKERSDQEETDEETVPVSVRSMEDAITGFQPLFKKRSTDGLEENIEVIK